MLMAENYIQVSQDETVLREAPEQLSKTKLEVNLPAYLSRAPNEETAYGLSLSKIISLPYLGQVRLGCLIVHTKWE